VRKRKAETVIFLFAFINSRRQIVSGY